MTTPAQISIVFPTFNRPDDVRYTLAEIRANADVPYELFIIDNGAEPSDYQLSPHEHYIFVGQNLGTASRNIGTERAQTPYVLMLDDDSHPLPDTLGAAIRALKALPPHVVGIIGAVTHLDGSREASLLPTVLLGCGVLFRTEALRHIGRLYPDRFGFYGEEYWMTLRLYLAGFHLLPSDQLQVCHRLSQCNRSLAQIFYHLGRNNGVIWKQFVPPTWMPMILADSYRRYELTSGKEGVLDAFRQGQAEALAVDGEATPLTEQQFADFSMLTQLRAAVRRCPVAPRLLLCGCGKFPSFWAEQLLRSGCAEVRLADFNPALSGHAYGRHWVETPEAALALMASGFQPVLGHNSLAETHRWEVFLSQHQVPKETWLEI